MNSIFGFTQLTTYVQKLKSDLPHRVHDGLKDAALLIVKATKENILHGRADWPAIKHPERRVARISRTQTTPLLDTGTLMRSIHSEVEPTVAIIGSNLKYAPPHEFGTDRAGRSHSVHIPARPYLTPAAQENMPEIKSIFIKRLQGKHV
jgi:phage virion morphogenesis protein